MRNTKLEDWIAGITFTVIMLIIGIGAWYNQTHKPYSHVFGVNTLSQITYKTEHDITVVTGNEVCLVYARYNQLGFQADVIICDKGERND